MKLPIIFGIVSILVLVAGLLIPSTNKTLIAYSKLENFSQFSEIMFTIKTNDFDYYLVDGNLKIESDDGLYILNPYFYGEISSFKLFLENWISIEKNKYLPPSNCEYLTIRINNPVDKITKIECKTTI